MEFNKKKAIGLSLLKAVQVEFFGFFVMIFFWAVKNFFGLFGNIMFGFTGLMCIVCIMADFGMKQGEIAREKARLHGDKVGLNFGFALGAAAMIPTYITAILLLLSKIGVIGNFLPAYKILNASYFALIDIPAHSAKVSDMPWGTLAMVFIFPLLYMFSCYIGYRISFNQVDVKEKVVYKHNKIS